MSARTAALRNTSAAVVAAAIAGTVLMPLSAHAAEGNDQALKTAMSAPVPSGPLTRGGATETFELTVTNPTGKASSYHPWMLLDHTGGSPVGRTDVVFKVEAVSAPATESAPLTQDGGWQGLFFPAGKPAQGFEIPAGGKMVWKVTVGLDKNYPTIDGDFTLQAASMENEIAKDGKSSLTFKTSPQTKPGELKNWFDDITNCQGTNGSACKELSFHYQVTGDGEFSTALATYFDMNNADGSPLSSDIQARIKVDGAWKDLTGGNGDRRLPVIPKGFGAASGDRVVRLQVKLGPKAPANKGASVLLTTVVGLAEGNTFGFSESAQKLHFNAENNTPAPTTPAPSSPAPTTPAPAGSAATTPATPASTATPSAANTPAATGSLAHTGSDSNTGLYSGLAAALIALGGAAAWLGARRRKAVRG